MLKRLNCICSTCEFWKLIFERFNCIYSACEFWKLMNCSFDCIDTTSNSGISTVGAASSPTVALGSVYSGASVTAASSPFTPTSNSGTSTVGAGSSPAVPIASVYSGVSVTAASSPFTPPSNSGTSCTAGSPLRSPLDYILELHVLPLRHH